MLGDRYPRVPVMLASDLLRAVGLATMAACVLTHAPVAVVYVLAATVAVINTAFQPAQSALLPSLAKTPEELTAANVSSSTIESLGFCVGPALGGLLLAVSTVWVVFAFTAGLFLFSALMLDPAPAHDRAAADSRAPAPGRGGDGRLPRDRARPASATRRRALLRADARERRLRRPDRGLGACSCSISAQAASAT